MNPTPWIQALLTFAGEHVLLGRLLLTSVEFAALAMGVGLLIFVCRLRQPRLRALLWLMVLAKPLVGLMLGTPLPLLRLGLPAPAPEPPAVVEAVPAFTQPVLSALSIPSIASLPSTPPPAPAPFDWRARLPELLLGAWLAGAGLLAARLGLSHLRLRRMLRRGATPPEWIAGRLAELAGELGLPRAPRCLMTPVLDSPALAGFWRPVILLPAWLGEEADPARTAWSLRHELMHWRLRDPLAAFVRELARILFFFHPAAWWAGRKWQEATEMACDRALIRSREDAESYATELYRMLVKIHARRRVPLAGGLFAGRTQISRRIASLARDPLRSPARLSVAAVVLVALLSAASLTVGVGVRSEAAEEKKDAEAKEKLISGTAQIKANSTKVDWTFPSTHAEFTDFGEKTGIVVLKGKADFIWKIGGSLIRFMGDEINVYTSSTQGLGVLEIRRPREEALSLQQLQLSERSVDNTMTTPTLSASADRVLIQKDKIVLSGRAVAVRRELGKIQETLDETITLTPGDKSGPLHIETSRRPFAITIPKNVPRPIPKRNEPRRKLKNPAPSNIDLPTPAKVFETLRAESLDYDEDQGVFVMKGKARAISKMGGSLIQFVGDDITICSPTQGLAVMEIKRPLVNAEARNQLLLAVGPADDGKTTPTLWVSADRALIQKDKVILSGQAMAVRREPGKFLETLDETITLTPGDKPGPLHIEHSKQPFAIMMPKIVPRPARPKPEPVRIELKPGEPLIEPIDPVNRAKGFRIPRFPEIVRAWADTTTLTARGVVVLQGHAAIAKSDRGKNTITKAERIEIFRAKDGTPVISLAQGKTGMVPALSTLAPGQMQPDGTFKVTLGGKGFKRLPLGRSFISFALDRSDKPQIRPSYSIWMGNSVFPGFAPGIFQSMRANSVEIGADGLSVLRGNVEIMAKKDGQTIILTCERAQVLQRDPKTGNPIELIAENPLPGEALVGDVKQVFVHDRSEIERATADRVTWNNFNRWVTLQGHAEVIQRKEGKTVKTTAESIILVPERKGEWPIEDGQIIHNQDSTLTNTYLVIVERRIEENFNPPAPRPGVVCRIRFQIEKNGTVTHIQTVKSTQDASLDRLAQVTLESAKMPPLYDGMKVSTLPVTVTFNFDAGPKVTVDGETNVDQEQGKAPSDADKRAAETFAARGWQLWNQRKLAEAEEMFQKAVAKDPANANAWNGLGWAQQNQAQPLNAKYSFEQCLKLNPRHAAALNGLGWIAKGEGKVDEAIGFWKRAVAAMPAGTAALAGLARTYLEQKNYPEAQKYFELWLKAEPGSEEAKAGLARAKAGKPSPEPKSRDGKTSLTAGAAAAKKGISPNLEWTLAAADTYAKTNKTKEFMSGRRDIPPVCWASKIRELKPIRVYVHNVNIVVVQRISGNMEEGKYISNYLSSYLPRNGDDGFMFFPNPVQGKTYWFKGIQDYKRVRPKS